MGHVKPHIAQALAGLVKEKGYACDSIAAASPFAFSEGFNLSCNRFRYKYEIENKGGNWIVTID